MKLGFSSNAFKKYTLEASITAIEKIGYDGVEILCDIPHAYPPNFDDKEIQSVKNTISSCGLEISNLNAFTLYAIGDVYRPSWIEKDEVLRKLRIEHTLDCIKLAKRIGAKNLSTEPGGPLRPDAERKILERMFIEGLNTVTEMAEKEQIIILVEPEPGLLIENSSQFKNLMRDIDSKYIRLNFDIGHFYCVNEDPAKLVYELADYVEHFHLADISKRVHNHLIPGRGDIDFRPVFSAMNDIGYDGYVTVELYPYQENPVEAAREAYENLCKVIESIR